MIEAVDHLRNSYKMTRAMTVDIDRVSNERNSRLDEARLAQILIVDKKEPIEDQNGKESDGGGHAMLI